MAGNSSDEEPRKRPAPPPVEFLKPGETQAPVPPADQPPAAWVPRPEEYQRQAPWSPPPVRPTAPSNLPKIAGILLILAAILGMAGAIYGQLTFDVPRYVNDTRNVSPAILAANRICGLLSIWSQAMALLGGIMAYQRMNWRLTVVCAIFSLGTIGFFLVEGSVLGLIGLILIVRARPFFLS